MTNEQRDGSGKFTSIYNDDDFLSALAHFDGAATTPEIAKRVGCTRTTAHRRLRKLAGNHEGVTSRDAGNTILWRLDREADLPTGESDFSTYKIKQLTRAIVRDSYGDSPRDAWVNNIDVEYMSYVNGEHILLVTTMRGHGGLTRGLRTVRVDGYEVTFRGTKEGQEEFRISITDIEKVN